MKIAVISINIGDYIVFWEDFYKSAEQNFFPGIDKKYFVFTDKTDVESLNKDNVQVVHQEDMGWPFNTMKRFHMFLRIEKDLEEYDYVFFANANSYFYREFNFNAINLKKKYVMVEHPGFHLKKKNEKPFERRRECKAYVSNEQGEFYVQGAFYGGKTDAFLFMTKKLDECTESDLNNGIVAVWHDESYLNRFVIDNIDNIQILGWQYLYFEEYYLPYDKMIVLRNKKKYLPKTNGRFKNQNIVKLNMYVLLRNIMWRANVLIGKYKWYLNYDEKTQRYIDTDISERKNNG